MKAALSQYEVDIQMSQDTLQALKQGGYTLTALKAVQTTINGAVPLVWFQTNQLQTTTSVAWQDQYQAYVSTSEIIPNGTIRTNSTTGIGLGQTAQVSAKDVITTVDGGTSSAISILNQANRPLTCGVSQAVNNQANPVWAAPLHGNMLNVVVPVEQVLLMFSRGPINTGTVMCRAYASALLIDLRRAAQRTVQFDINNGWSWGGWSWAQQVRPSAELVPVLIQR